MRFNNLAVLFVINFIADCLVQLVPRFPGLSSTDSISAFIAGNGSLMVLDSASDTYGVGRLFSNSDRLRQQPGGPCSISNLRVVRGQSNTIEIGRSGFMSDINIKGTIQMLVC